MKLPQIYRAFAVIPADGACKITWKTIKNWRLNWRQNEYLFKNIQSNFTLISLITFGVLNQTSPNLQGSCRNTCRWCLRNYMINGKELTSELMSKWITFENTQANLTLISLKTFEVLHQTSSYLQGSCRYISWWCLQNYVTIGWELAEIPAKIG